MWPGLDSRTRHHMWVEFVVGSRPWLVFLEHLEAFRARIFFLIQLLSSSDKVFIPLNSAACFVNFGFFCLAFKIKEYEIFVGKLSSHNKDFRVRNVCGDFEKRTLAPSVFSRSSGFSSLLKNQHF